MLVGDAAWPCSRCGGRNALDRDSCGACGAGFLAAVREAESGLVLPVVGDLTRMSRGRRMGLAVAAVAVLVVPVALVSLLGTGRPPAEPASPAPVVSTTR